MRRIPKDEVGAAPPAAPIPGLPEKVAFLGRPDSYPDDGACVEALETHMSWLFLTERHAYKLKKPFRRDRIDYLTVSARRRSCLDELRLNQRLAPDVYRAVVPLTLDSHGRMAIDGAGRAIDWLVHMRRMPASLALDQRLCAREVDAEDSRRIIERLVPFIAAAPRAPWTGLGYRRRLAGTIRISSRELLRAEFGLPRPEIDDVASRLRRAITANREFLDERADNGRIVEGHGDLRPEHIYLTDPPTVMDCIEFDRDLRLRDPVDELSFLVMEAEGLGHEEFGTWLFAAYRELAEDDPPQALIAFHKALNAFVRARIAILHLEDEVGPREPWIARTRDYLRRARDYLEPS